MLLGVEQGVVGHVEVQIVFYDIGSSGSLKQQEKGHW